ncbi:hypothetical protein ACE38W_16920 [Chitinophaga sp. Hz27]|uniref:hypothetical protein n=1 Tax=Chitinophaga sp. Hz27 TaxID=3347169 RepID=UPI0035D79B86
MKADEKITMKAIALCFKPFLKPEEALIYTNLERTALAKRCEEAGIYKNDAGYFKKEDLDRMMSGAPSLLLEKAQAIKL